MKIRFSFSRGWEVCFVQCGAVSGWSEWESYDRLDALYKIEKGFQFDYVD